jgi:DNA-binding transcriptional MerR regulator
MGQETNYSKIEEVALRTGLTKRALRYYEDIHLLHPVRGESGYRLFAEEDIEKLIRIKELKESLGFTLNEVKDILELENGLKTLWNENRNKKEEIQKSMEKIQKQIGIIESKEQTLGRAKAKYNDALNRLEGLLLEVKEHK